MARDKRAAVDGLLHQLIGKQTWGLGIGPAGVNIQFGALLYNSNPKRKPNGEHSVWIKCALLVKNKTQTVWQSGPCPAEEEQELLSALGSGKIVSDVAVDWRRNVLRMVLGNAYLLSAYPVIIGSRSFPWIVYDRSHSPVRYAVVGLKKVDLRQGESRGNQ
jgi:hypothetical protein